MSLKNLTAEQLKIALDLKKKIESMEAELDSIMGNGAPKTHRISEEGRAKIAAAQRKRWDAERKKKKG